MKNRIVLMIAAILLLSIPSNAGILRLAGKGAKGLGKGAEKAPKALYHGAKKVAHGAWKVIY